MNQLIISDNKGNNYKVDNPKQFNGETISHFPGGPGNYKNKIVKMSNFMKDIMFNCVAGIYIFKIFSNKFFIKIFSCKYI